MSFIGKLKDVNRNTLSFKQNFMWLTGGVTGMLVTQRWIMPEADLSPAILVGILLGGNMGAYIRNTSKTGRVFDERDRKNMEEAMSWGFMTAVTLLGLNLLELLNFSSDEILLASATIALVVTLIQELRQNSLKDVIYSG